MDCPIKTRAKKLWFQYYPTNISIIHCQRYQINYGRFRRKHDQNVFHIFIQLGSMRPSADGPMHDVHRVGAIRLPIRSSLLNACRLNPIMNIDTSYLPLADILGEKDEKSNKFNYLRKRA